MADAVPSFLPRPAPTDAPTRARADRRARLFHLVAMTVFGLTFALWIGCVAYVPEAIDRDWVAFDAAADRLVDDAPAEVYRASMREEWPFLYPPYVLPIVAPLAMLGRTASYALAAGAGLVAVGLSLRLLRRAAADELGVGELGRTSGRDADVVRAGVLGSGVVLANVITGQFAPLYLLGLATALWAWRHGRHTLAGAALGVLLIKPYLAVPFVGYLVLRGDRRALAGFSAVAAVAAVVGVAFGGEPWRAYLESLQYMAAKERIGLTPTSKQVTFVSAVRVVALGGGSAGWLSVLWLVVVVGVGAAVVVALRRAARAGDIPLLRTFGLVALVAVVCSPRLYFYDAILAVVPAVAWYTARSSYRSRHRHRAIGLCIAASVIAFDTILTPWPATHLAGVAGLVWLLLEASDLADRRPEPTSPPVAVS